MHKFAAQAAAPAPALPLPGITGSYFTVLEALVVILTPLFFMPLMTAFMAYSHGRSFWRWFSVGCALPYVSLFVIMFVVHRDKKKLAAVAVA